MYIYKCKEFSVQCKRQNQNKLITDIIHLDRIQCAESVRMVYVQK